jgi:hypothetical protein
VVVDEAAAALMTDTTALHKDDPTLTDLSYAAEATKFWDDCACSHRNSDHILYCNRKI